MKRAFQFVVGFVAGVLGFWGVIALCVLAAGELLARRAVHTSRGGSR